MDNAESVATTVPQGQTDATTQAPSTTSGETPQNSAEGADQTQTPQGESGEGEEKLLAGKFKSVEDLERSYQELQSHNTKVEMERAELEKLFAPQAKQTPEVQQPEQGEQPQPDTERISQAVREAITQMISPAIAKLEVQDMLNKYGDTFRQVAPQVAKIKTEKNISMEDAFKLATYPTIERTSYVQGVTKVNAVNEQKQKAVVESSRPSGYRPASIEEAIKSEKTSVSEIADALGPKWSAFKEISEKKKRMGNPGF